MDTLFDFLNLLSVDTLGLWIVFENVDRNDPMENWEQEH